MKATIEIPDDLYRRVKAKSALEGRPIRAVTIELFQRWLDEDARFVDRPAERSAAAERACLVVAPPPLAAPRGHSPKLVI